MSNTAGGLGPRRPTSTKAVGGALGSGVGYQINKLFLYYLYTCCDITVPKDIEESMGALIVAFITFVGVYMTPPNH